LSDSEKRKSRLVLSPGVLNPGEFIMVFNDNKEFKSPKSEFPFVAVDGPQGVIPRALVRPGQPYKVVQADPLDHPFDIFVLEPYGKVRMGVWHSPGVFLKDEIELANTLRGVGQDRIFTINMTDPVNMSMPIPHIDMMAFYDMIKVFALNSPGQIEMHIGEHEKCPIMLRNIPNSPEDFIVTIVLTPIDLNYEGQIR
jgi:hypothetical protein